MNENVVEQATLAKLEGPEFMIVSTPVIAPGKLRMFKDAGDIGGNF